MNAVLKDSQLVAANSERSLTAADISDHVQLIQAVMKKVMIKDVHYGIIPGCKQPSLYKAGSEVLLTTFRIAVGVFVDDISKPDSVGYRVRVVGTHQGSGIIVGEGVGECSSDEEKYKWRKAYKREWDSTPESRRRVKFGWDNSKRSECEILQVRTEPADVANTVLKMAKKRGQIDMTLTATAASDCFAQDLEDMPEGLRGDDDAPRRESAGKAAVSKAQATDDPERDKVVAALYDCASMGDEALMKAWQALTEPQRQSVGVEFGKIKKAVPK